MSENEILELLKPIFQEVFMVEDLNLYPEMDASMVEKWDSLTHMILITQIEKKFLIKFNLMDLISMKNVGDMVKLVQQKK